MWDMEKRMEIEACTVESEGRCLVWTKTTNRTGGYGQIWCDGKRLYVHRVVWELNNGPIPDEMCVLHHCDNPPCCNLDHLFLGTPKQNMVDASVKGRMGRLLSCEQVRDVRRRALAESYVSIADSLGVNPYVVRYAATGRSHKHCCGENAISETDRMPARERTGERRHALSTGEIEEILATPRYHGSGSKLARKFGVSQATISRIRKTAHEIVNS